MGHHHHHHDHHHGNNSNLKVAFFLNLAFTIFEIIGGIYVNSVAIISDAIHDLGDSLSLGSAWYLQNLSNKKSDKKFSFGYARFSLLGALINSAVLIAGSIFVVYEAVGRLMNPESSDANGMMLFAFFGIAVNGYAAWKMSGGKTLNERVISWHLVEDVLGWVAILIVAIVLQFKDIQYLDPALSLLITCYILWGVVLRLKETLFLFLQGVPKEIDASEIEQQILNIPKIDSMHHTHIWSLEGEHHVYTSHVKICDITNIEELPIIKKAIKQILKKYPFSHYTIELEINDEPCDMIEYETHHD